MRDDQLKRSLEELFSDLSVPAPEAEAEPLPPPSPPVQEPPPEPEAEPLPPAQVLTPPPSLDVTVTDEQEEIVDEEEASVLETISLPEDMQIWRQQLVRGVLRTLLVVGLLAVVAGSYEGYVNQKFWAIPLYWGLFAIGLLLTFWRRASYTLQAGGLLAVLYTLGMIAFISGGLGDSGRMYLLTIPFAAGLFFGWRESIFALVFAFLTMAGLGWAFSTGRITGYEEITSVAPSLWLGITFELLMLGTFIVVSLNYLVPRLAAALTQSRNLAQELETQRAGLEEQVTERTHELEEANKQLQRHTTQLRASAKIGRAATSILNIDELFHTTVNLIHDEFGFYYAGVFLIDETGEWAVLQAASGKVGQRMKAQGHRLALDDHSIVGWVAAHCQSRVVLDVRKETKHFVNPLLPHTRSEMTLPLMIGERPLGVLDVHSTEEAAFDEDDVRTLRLMADQIAVAIDNARKFSDEALLLEAISPIYRASRRLTTATTTDEVADAVIASVAETGADGCVVVEFESSPAGELEALLYLGVWRRDREPQFQAGMRLPITESPFPSEMVGSLWTVADTEQDERLPQSARQVFEATDARALSNIPLRTREGVIGQVVVIRTTPGPFSDAALRLYEMLSDQASVALERARLLEKAQRRAEHERLVSEITAKIRRPLDMDAILRVSLRELGTALGASEGLVRLGISDGADRK